MHRVKADIHSIERKTGFRNNQLRRYFNELNKSVKNLTLSGGGKSEKKTWTEHMKGYASSAWEGTKDAGSRLGKSAWEGTKDAGSRLGKSAWEGTKGYASSAWEGTKGAGRYTRSYVTDKVVKRACSICDQQSMTEAELDMLLSSLQTIYKTIKEEYKSVKNIKKEIAARKKKKKNVNERAEFEARAPEVTSEPTQVN